MRRLEYMTILRQKLIDGGLSNDEVNDALEFYEELFLDAGYENEEKTAMNLGDPEKLAAQILAENGAVGFVKQPEPKIDDVIDNRGQQQQNSAASAPVDPGYDIAPDNRKTALIIIVLATSIIWAPILFGLTAAAFGIAIGLTAAIFAIGVSGIGVLVVGGVTAFQAPPVGILMMGIGIFMIGLGVLIMVPFIKLVVKLFKTFFLWLGKTLGSLFNKVRSDKAVSSNG